MKIALITAGGAGMFCGSCMQDNTLVRALRLAGADAVLIPTYTPITVDEDNASLDRIFLGGINVYLDSRIPGWRFLPRGLRKQLDRPGFVRLLSGLSGATSAAKLGPLTVDMLAGARGPQRTEIAELCEAVVSEVRPDVVLFSNALLSGVIPTLQERFSGPVHVILQGDDIFLNALLNPWRDRALQLIRDNCRQVRSFLTHSRYYATAMSALMGLPAEAMRQIPLSLDTDLLDAEPAAATPGREFTVGYFARICPEKGVHRLLDDSVADALRAIPDSRLVIAGFLPRQHRKWFRNRLVRAQRVLGPDRLRWLGSPADRLQKFQLLRSMDVLCVPTEYHEPKGLFVLEAALAGVPSVLPRHGAFPERIECLRFGSLFDPSDPAALPSALTDAFARRDEHIRNRAALQSSVREHHSMDTTGRAVLQQLAAL